MKVLKLPWLTHQEGQRKYEIYTIDLSADGERAATGGLDGKIRIWSVSNILQFAKPKDEWPAINEQIKKPLASMNRHTGSVTALKFSPDGKYLASGSDDKILLIWEREEGTIQHMFGSDNELEHWNVRRRLVAHDNDIQEICWAPDLSILVSVGLDRSIIVWNGATFEKIKRFDVHQSHVKGVVFDPANKYFATASDDRTVKIFRYHKGADLSFTIEHIITEPFLSSPLTTYFRRLSWSPDGQHIAVPNATNGPVSTVAIISRGSWDTSVSLVGHDQPTEVACFNPRLFEHVEDGDDHQHSSSEGKEEPGSEAGNDKKRKHTDDRVDSVIATAGQDKTVAIWNTNKARPLVVAYDIATKSITDMSWTADGGTLFLTSLDSQIIVLVFEANELGNMIPLKQNVEHLYRYGADKDSVVFPESVMQLRLEDEARKTKKPEIKTTELLESRIGTVAKPNVLAARPKEPTKIQPSQVSTIAPTKKLTHMNKVVVQNGKKRVVPTLISGGYSPVTVTFESRAAEIDPSFADKNKPAKTEQHVLKGKISKSAYPIPRLGVHTLIMGVRERDQERFYVDEQSGSNIDDLLEEEEEAPEHKLTLNAKTSIEKIWKDEPSTRYLEYPGCLPDADVVVCECGDIDDLYVLEIRNGVERAIQFDREALFDNPTRILGYYKGERTLEAFIPDVIISCIGSRKCKCWALATANGAIYFYSSNGQLKIPQVFIGHKIIKFSTCEEYLIALTESYLFYVWDLEKMKLIFKEISALPVLLQEPAIANRSRPTKRIQDFSFQPDMFKLTVLLTDGISYIWENDLGCWTEPTNQEKKNDLATNGLE
ncbi:HGL087Wp [Eremothecium sinecaudum]|uniref:Protein HIR n=1 Tax=Eremothecium sinecaudum TaxID=45286 RepID=A0A0X8HVM7_9SACH|nr:HGL087Wp [Eremothecium sinecaudum]AMD22253.1 HGL087Wp [Eremothecium sinecaudum]